MPTTNQKAFDTAATRLTEVEGSRTQQEQTMNDKIRMLDLSNQLLRLAREARHEAEQLQYAARVLVGRQPSARKNNVVQMPRRRHISAAGRASIAASQRARWAKWRRKQRRAA